MAAAQRLATATSIDLAVARSHSDKRTKAQTPMQRTITIGNAGTRGLRTYVQLFAVIAHANDVKCDVASNSTFVYAYGFAEDIDASHALYASLVMQMVRASDAYIVHRRASADPDHHRAAQLPAGLRRPRRATAGRSARGGPARGDQERDSAPRHRDRLAEQGDRAEGLLPGGVRGARHLAGDQRDGGVLVVGAARRRPRGPAGPAGRRPGVARRAHARWSGDQPETPSAPRSTPPRSSSGRCSTAPPSTATAPIDFFGAQLTLPPEARFASVEAVQRYVDDVLALRRCGTGGRRPAVDGARRGAGSRAAHYERDDDGGHDRGPGATDRWALAGTGGAARDRPPSVPSPNRRTGRSSSRRSASSPRR